MNFINFLEDTKINKASEKNNDKIFFSKISYYFITLQQQE